MVSEIMVKKMNLRGNFGELSGELTEFDLDIDIE